MSLTVPYDLVVSGKDHYVYLMRNDAVRPNDLNYIRFAIRNIAVPNSEIFSTLAVDSTDQIDPVI